MATKNLVAQLPAAKAPVEIVSKEIPTLPEDTPSVIIKVHAIAFNPVDGKLAVHALWPLPYPTVLGSDIAGTVHASSSPKFSPGDRVAAYTNDGGYQQYAVTPADQVWKLADSRSFAQGAALAMGFLTSAGALWLGAGLPVKPGQGKGEGKVLVAGGGSSVGGYGIQYAAAAGYEVVTTASASRAASLKALGASHVVDYSDTDAAVAELKSLGPYVAIYDAVSTSQSLTIISKILTPENKKIITVLGDFGKVLPEGVEAWNAWPIELLKDAELKKWTFEYLEKGDLVPTEVEERKGGLKIVQKVLEGGLDGYKKKVVINPQE